MIITKALKYKIIEYCIDNFFNTLSRNFRIYEDDIPFTIIIEKKQTSIDSWSPGFTIKILGREFSDIDLFLSLETIQDFATLYGKIRFVDEIIYMLLAQHVIKLKESVGQEVLDKIIIELRSKIRAAIISLKNT